MTLLAMPRSRKRIAPPGKRIAPPGRAQDSAWNASLLREAWTRADPVPTEVAAAVGVTTETLRRWRRGIFVPNVLELRALARALGVPPASLLPE